VKPIRPLQKVWKFYADGFRNMPSWGRQAWAVVIFKGIIFFIIMKFVFFPNYLKKNYDTDEQRSEYVLDQLTKTK
jgi:predicted lactoylglutathione lyase